MIGEVCDANGGDHHWRWGYHDRSEVTGADRCDTTTLTGNCSHLTPGDYDYTYDPIGNRTQATQDSAATHYCANNVNQYTLTHDGSGSCPPSVPSLYYDEDGNLISDAEYQYLWDAENRLAGAIPLYPTAGSQAALYEYDYMSRRIAREIYAWNTQIQDWEYDSELRFVYDQWNVVLVLDDANDIIRKYTWGLDLSGQRGSGVAPGVSPVVPGIHGAGGIGGLLAVEETAESGTPKYWFLYDANGNVGQLVANASGYAVAARYEYDAYGAVIGPDTDNDGDWQDDATALALANPVRFSTKWLDEESSLGYWGYRYYTWEPGRWLNRDPLGELGGLSDYCYVNNRVANSFDPAGLLEFEPTTQCKYQCGQCYNRCREQGGTATNCEPRWERCHWSCRTSGIPPRECDEPPGPTPPAPGTCQTQCSLAGTMLVRSAGCKAITAGTPIPHDDIAVGAVTCACILYIIIAEAAEAPRISWPDDDPDDKCYCLCKGVAEGIEEYAGYISRSSCVGKNAYYPGKCRCSEFPPYSPSPN